MNSYITCKISEYIALVGGSVCQRTYNFCLTLKHFIIKMKVWPVRMPVWCCVHKLQMFLEYATDPAWEGLVASLVLSDCCDIRFTMPWWIQLICHRFLLRSLNTVYT